MCERACVCERSYSWRIFLHFIATLKSTYLEFSSERKKKKWIIFIATDLTKLLLLGITISRLARYRSKIEQDSQVVLLCPKWKIIYKHVNFLVIY